MSRKKEVPAGTHYITIQVPLDCETAETLIRFARAINRPPGPVAGELLGTLLEDPEFREPALN